MTKTKLSVLLCLLLVTMTTAAQKFDYIYQGVEFKCKLTGADVTITSFSVKATKVVVPARVTYRDKEYPVKTIDVFLNGVNYLAEELVVEEGVTDIAKFAFNEFRKLRTVSLPSSLQHIGRNAVRVNAGTTLYLASNIDEQAVRNGKETWPMASTSQTRTSPMLMAAKDKPKEVTAKPETKEVAAKDKPKETRRNSTKGIIASEIVKAAVSTPPAEEAVDVDINIPTTTTKQADIYCVIIANEQYDEVPNVDYAKHDGEVFKEYCNKTLGIPERNIRTYWDATYTTIKRAVNWITTTASVTGGQSKFIFYYAGHGMPGEKDRMAYLLPTDGMPKDATTCYKLSELYAHLGKISAQSVTVLLDACFSGMKRGESQPLVAARAIAVETKTEPLSGNVVVFSAASGDETAMAYQEKRHGMFTYYVLDKLKATKGKVTLGELYESVSSAVKRSSWLENEKLQSPSVNVSGNMKTKWKNLTF